MKRTFLLIILMITLFNAPAVSQENFKLQIKAKEGEILNYEVSAGCIINADLDQLPFPGSVISAKNVKAEIVFNSFMETKEVLPNEARLRVRTKIKKTVFGDLLQMYDVANLNRLFEMDTTMGLTQYGKINNFKINTLWITEIGNIMKPGNGTGGFPFMKNMSIDKLLPAFVSILPPIFPETPLAAGATWTQYVNFDRLPIRILPKMPFEFSLNKIEGNTATVFFESKNNYDGASFKKLVAVFPEISMGDDMMKIKKINNFLSNWDTSGEMHFNIDKGIIEDVTVHSDYSIDAGWDVQFTHKDKTKESWKPKLNMKIGMDVKIVFKGYLTPNELESQLSTDSRGRKQE